MGSFSHGIADAIRHMGDAQAQGALQKGAVYGNLAHDLGQAPMQYLAIDRGLHENRYRQTLQDTQTKKIQAEEELKSKLAAAPDGPARWTITRDWASINAPELAQQMDMLSYKAAENQYQGDYGQVTPNPIQAGLPGQLPPTVGSPVVPLEQQQTPNQPVHFPSIAGRPAFDRTAPNQQEASITDFMQKLRGSQATAQGKVLGEAGKERIIPPGSLIRQAGKADEQVPFRPPAERPTPNLNPTQLFHDDPAAYEKMQDTNARITAKYRKEPAAAGGAGAELKMKQTRLAIKAKKERKLSDLEKEFKFSTSPGALGKSSPMSSDQLQQRKDQIQQEFLDDLEIAGLGTSPGEGKPLQGLSSAVPEVTATGPNGEQIVLRNGKWVPK